MKRGLERMQGCVLEPVGDSLSEALGWLQGGLPGGEVRGRWHNRGHDREFVQRDRFIL